MSGGSSSRCATARHRSRTPWTRSAQARRRSHRRAPAVPAVRRLVDGHRGRARDGARAASWNVPAIDVVPAFYDDPGLPRRVRRGRRAGARRGAARSRAVLVPRPAGPPDHARPTTRAPTASQSETCCDTLTNPNCYRAQCYFTARALAPAARRSPPIATRCASSRGSAARRGSSRSPTS